VTESFLIRSSHDFGRSAAVQLPFSAVRMPQIMGVGNAWAKSVMFVPCLALMLRRLNRFHHVFVELPHSPLVWEASKGVYTILDIPCSKIFILSDSERAVTDQTAPTSANT